ncbi:hypothetical protein B0A48_10551 [Cryoendolithus antarcticus]|uniref:ARID domain-containing protein n=1 Tax=Cryoendolithus antarcticus TaxID=1507870 RepID=A0A1V8SXW1_9PEZI|nr:hypothetical protein B0A48_10551 [Cryoendolithus antarcticus]
MAPKRGQSIEGSDEYDEFLKKLAEYHEKRGTNLETAPKVGIRHIDLLKLYDRVVGEGGYDLVSDTKAKPLMWRKLAEEFVGKNQYTAAQAFQIKNIYYKNLVAYEITNHWEKEPPPKEIVEEVTAKGGNVMSRTLENFVKPPSREEKLAGDGDASDGSPSQKTPKEEKGDPSEEPGSATGRTSRGLRHQPPQRVLFQPDPAAQGRRSNNNAGPSPTPGPTTNGINVASYFSNAATATLASYEPTPSYPLTLKPITTPSNNPEYYRNERKRKLEANAGPLARKYRNIMLPGTGFIGPNIYVRAQLALQSGIPDEEAYALHHLVKISHERGDKYKFEQFPGLIDALARKVLQATGLFYDIEWDVSYEDEVPETDEELLDGLSGTSGLVSRLRSRQPRLVDDSIMDDKFVSELNRIIEACLVIRNMCILDSNAVYAAQTPLVRDMLALVLNLPDHACIVELRHYALDIAEQTLRYIDIGAQDDLYQSLVAQLRSSDRGVIVTTLRTIARIGMSLQAPKRLEDIPPMTLRRIQNWLLLDDDELRSACLDFLLQYSSFADNVDTLLQSVDLASLARQLTSLLSHGAQAVAPEPTSESKPPDTALLPVPKLSRSVVQDLLTLDEPERSSEWLRMCFLPDAKSEMTQISLWQAYQGTFSYFNATHPHLVAGEFIKNVSAVFAGATAQVAGQNKYVIRGIRARRAPAETGMSRASEKGRELLRCCWRSTVPVDAARDPVTGIFSAPTVREVECAEWFRSENEMLRHILATHLRLPLAPPKMQPLQQPDGMDIDSKPSTESLTNGHASPSIDPNNLAQVFDFASADPTTFRCHWGTCTRLSSEFAAASALPGSTALLFARHIQTHLPSPTPSTYNLKSPSKSSSTFSAGQYTTLTDERNDAAGLPLGAALVLRNIARFMPKGLDGEGGEEGDDDGEGDMELGEEFFDRGVRGKLFGVLSESRTLRHYVGGVLRGV